MGLCHVQNGGQTQWRTRGVWVSNERVQKTGFDLPRGEPEPRRGLDREPWIGLVKHGIVKVRRFQFEFGQQILHGSFHVMEVGGLAGEPREVSWVLLSLPPPKIPCVGDV